MDELLGEFLSETVESLENLDHLLISLEETPEDSEIVGQIFRILHTIKGTCGFLGFGRLQHLSHAGESVLGKVREGVLQATPDIISTLLKVLDRLNVIVKSIEENQTEAAGSDEDLITVLNKVLTDIEDGNKPAEAQSTSSAPSSEPAQPTSESENKAISEGENKAIPNENEESQLSAQMKAGEGDSPVISEEDLRELQKLDEMIAQQNKIAREKLQTEQTAVNSATAQPKEAAQTTASPHPEALSGKKDNNSPALKEVQPAAQEVAKTDEKKDASSDSSRHDKAGAVSAAQSIRVNVDTLENLMTLVSELVLTRNQLIQLVKNTQDSSIMNAILNLSHITSELQEGVMKTRMQPISNAWTQLPRLVRGLSQDLNKKIDLIQLGGDTELDRQVLELIRDPLIHMIRNAADHGLEGTGADRIAAGKPEAGKITLNAYHEGGHIIIEISDDGKGIDPIKIKQKVIEKELVTPAAIDNMSEGQILHFIFKAGFSTAAKITNVSGRGVGMDVVRSNIEKLGGSIDLQSKVGQGTRFFIKIPLTLSIISGLIIECGNQRFAIPQINVDELVRVGGNSEYIIETINDVPFIRLRGHLLPLIGLSGMLGLKNNTNEIEKKFGLLPSADLSRLSGKTTLGDSESLLMTAQEGENLKPSDLNSGTIESVELTEYLETMRKVEQHSINVTEQYIVVSNAGNIPFGIVVDQVYDTQEIVVKPLSKLVRHSNYFSGATILGDGRVVMILDPIGVASSMGDLSIGSIAMETKEDSDSATESDRMQLLLFNVGEETKAVPLALVTRIDEILTKDIEKIHDMSLIQYRGQLLPLIIFPEIDLEEVQASILIFTDRGRSVGMVISEIADVVEVNLDMHLRSTVPGVLGSAIISGHSTSIIDCEYYLRKALTEWFALSRDDKAPKSRGKLLLVDDSSFFRNLITPMLTVAGYHVTTAHDGSEGLKIVQNSPRFDAIVSDIEMPVMDGYELVSRIRADSNYVSVPIIAISGKEENKDIQKCLDKGFSHFVSKTDQQALLQLLSEIVKAAPMPRSKDSKMSHSAPPA